MRIFSHPVMADHLIPDGMPECPDRYTALINMIAETFPEITIEQCHTANEADLLRVHTQHHIEAMNVGIDTMIDGDTFLSAQSFNAACHAAGAAIDAIHAVLSGDSSSAFALTRPPGHHASADKAEGFCIFNTIFIAARKAAHDHPDLKILIIDFDVHHGNGTESLLRDYIDEGGENIAYASIHQEGIYPGTGFEQSSHIYNCPLLAGCGSSDLRDAVTYDLIPFAQKFSPDIILYSAGFDGHRDDPLAGLKYEHEDFAWIVDQFRPVCEKQVSVLEGGYNLDALPVSVKHHLKALAKL